jgi:cytochrome c-type biogenesis protein CcmF
VRSPYAGYLVHLGIALMFLGFAGQAFQHEESVALSVGQTRSFGKYTIRFDGFLQAADRQKKMITAELVVLIDGKPVGRLMPARWYYDKRPNEPATEVAILRGLVEDLYVTMGKHDLDEGTAALKLVTNPLVDWMWLGFLLMAAATIVALLPDSKALSAMRHVRLAPISLAVTLGATSVALAFGVLVAKLTWGAPLVLLALGGFGLGLVALALYHILDPLVRKEATTSAERRASIEEELRARLAAVSQVTE